MCYGQNVPTIIAAVLLAIGASGCRGGAEKVADQAIFDAKLAEVRASGVSGLPAKAGWFRPYYHQLLGVEGDFYVVPAIMTQHGRWYAIQQLERLLEVERGESQKRAAALLYVFSFQLHPRAETLLRRLDQGDPMVRAVLSSQRAAEQDEEARQITHVSVEAWSGLSKAEKWAKVRAALSSRPVDADLD